MEKSRNSDHRPKSRALSAGLAVWQSQGMALAAAFALALAFPVAAAPGGDLGTMPAGDYICELPGDVSGPAGLRVPSEDFTVVTASSYRAAGLLGSYLLTGDRLAMTGGAFRGKIYERQSEGFVRRINADGKPGNLRCVRRKPNNS